MGRICPNQVWALTFNWSALATWNKHSWTAFWKFFSGIPHLPGFGDMPGARCQHLAPEFPGARCFVPGDMIGGQVGVPWKGLSKCSTGMLISGRLVYTRQNLWPKPDKGNFAPCIPPCKISGWQKSGKERILSKTPFLTFVYLSKYIKLPVIFGNAKESFFFD